MATSATRCARVRSSTPSRSARSTRCWRRRGGRIGLRINPALDAATHPHLATGAAGSKFGIALDEVPTAIDRVRAAGGALESIGAHIGSAIGETVPFGRLARLLRGLADDHGIGTVDLGGGFDGEPAAWAVRSGRNWDPLRVIVEPGSKHRRGRGLAAHPRRSRAGSWPPRCRCGHDRADSSAPLGARHPVTLLAGAAPPRRGDGRWLVRCARRATCWPRTSIWGRRRGRERSSGSARRGLWPGDGIGLQRAPPSGAGRHRGRRASAQPPARDARGRRRPRRLRPISPRPRLARIRGRP